MLIDLPEVSGTKLNQRVILQGQSLLDRFAFERHI